MLRAWPPGAAITRRWVRCLSRGDDAVQAPRCGEFFRADPRASLAAPELEPLEPLYRLPPEALERIAPCRGARFRRGRIFRGNTLPRYPHGDGCLDRMG